MTNPSITAEIFKQLFLDKKTSSLIEKSKIVNEVKLNSKAKKEIFNQKIKTAFQTKSLDLLEEILTKDLQYVHSRTNILWKGKPRPILNIAVLEKNKDFFIKCLEHGSTGNSTEIADNPIHYICECDDLTIVKNHLEKFSDIIKYSIGYSQSQKNYKTNKEALLFFINNNKKYCPNIIEYCIQDIENFNEKHKQIRISSKEINLSDLNKLIQVLLENRSNDLYQRLARAYFKDPLQYLQNFLSDQLDNGYKNKFIINLILTTMAESYPEFLENNCNFKTMPDCIQRRLDKFLPYHPDYPKALVELKNTHNPCGEIFINSPVSAELKALAPKQNIPILFILKMTFNYSLFNKFYKNKILLAEYEKFLGKWPICNILQSSIKEFKNPKTMAQINQFKTSDGNNFAHFCAENIFNKEIYLFFLECMPHLLEEKNKQKHEPFHFEDDKTSKIKKQFFLEQEKKQLHSSAKNNIKNIKKIL